MKALVVARKTLLEFWREPQLSILLLIFPSLFVLLYYVAFGQADKGMAQYLRVLVVNDDAGAATLQDERRQAGAQFIDMMRQAEFDGKPVFTVAVVADRREGENALREGKAALLLLIPPDLTQVLSGQAAAPATLTFVGDPASDYYAFAVSFLDDMARQFAQGDTERQAEAVTVNYEFLPGTGNVMSDFQYGVPGMLVFGILFLIFSTPTVLVRETVRGTWRRLRLARLSSADLLIGVTLAQMVAALLQMLITFGVAALCGFKTGALPVAIGVGMLLSLAAVGLGLIVACFANNDGEAVNLASGFLVPVTFLSGAIFAMPKAPIATIAGRTIQAYDVLPSAHAAEALRRVMVFGDGPGAILYELVALAILSALYLAAGVILYQQLRMNKS